MSKRRAKVLTDRDRALMQFIGEGGIASLDQIARRHWTTGAANAENRLAQLQRAGYLQAHTNDTRKPGQPERLYALTKKGAGVFDQVQRKRLWVGKPNTSELRQQLMLQDVRIRLEAQARAQGERLSEWRSERELRGEHNRLVNRALTEGRKVPEDQEIADARAVFVNETTGEVRELDIEADGQYFGKMLRSKAQRFGQSARPVLWSCEGARRSANVSRACSRYQNVRVMNLRG
jgi:predicted ArsR family transcriptional regulator